jgi:hypothetical protein
MEEKAKKNEEKIRINKGYCYLVKEEKPELSSTLFERFTARSNGLYITRIYPGRLRERMRLRNSKVVWLSHAPGENRCHPSALTNLANTVLRVLEKKGTVLIDGLEYLMIENGFNQSLIFIEHLNEFVMQNGGLVIIPVNPKAFNEKELALMERNLEVLEGALGSGGPDYATLIEKY